MKIREKDFKNFANHINRGDVIRVHYKDKFITNDHLVIKIDKCKGPYGGVCPSRCQQLVFRAESRGGLCLSPDLDFIEIVSKNNVRINSVMEI